MISALNIRNSQTNRKWVCFFIALFTASFTYAQSPCFNVIGADPNATLIRGCVPFTITLDDACTAGGTQIKYTYGDSAVGINAGIVTKTHTYTRPGLYSITQYGNFANGGSSLEKNNYIEVLPVPEPDFAVSTCAGREVALQITNSGYDSYVIDWGDGTGAQAAPSPGLYRHTYVNVNPRNVTVAGRYNGTNCGGSKSLVVNPVASLSKPILVSLTTLGNASAEIRFQAEAGILYHVEKRNETTNTYSEVIVLTSTTTGVVGQRLNDAQPATYRVTTVDNCGNAVPSDEISSILIGGTADNGRNLVSWQTYPVATFLKSTLNRNSQPIKENTLAIVSSYTDAEVICGETYCYQLQIDFNGSGAKSISNSACVNAVSSDVPPPIQNVSATVVDNKVVLTWDAPNGNASVREFVVSRSSDGGAYASIARITGNQYTDEDSRLDISRQCYKVSYFDKCGNSSDNSNETCPVFLKVQQITDPGNEGYQLTWTPYSQWASGVQSYEIEKLRSNNTVIEAQSSNGNELFFPYDTINQLLRFRVRAIGEGGISESNIVEIRQDVRVFAPEAFTPNGDGFNDRFEVRGLFVKKYKITIYNRWGEAVYGSEKMDAGWDGRNNRYTALTGTYTYSIRIEDQIDRVVVKKGSILVIRD